MASALGLRWCKRCCSLATGPFTQEDPIGLAGGFNLYGFANGDPINFSDPFGLAACKSDDCRGDGISPEDNDQEIPKPTLTQTGTRDNPRYQGLIVSGSNRPNPPPPELVMNVDLSDRPGEIALLALTTRTETHPGGRFFGKSYKYEGTLTVGGIVYSAAANVRTVGSNWYFGNVSAHPRRD